MQIFDLSRFDSGTTALFFAFSVERLGQILAAFFDFVKFLKINFSTGSTGSLPGENFDPLKNRDP